MSDTSHVAEDVLMRYAEDRCSAEERSIVEAHLLRCRSCQKRADHYRALATALADEETWHFVEQIQGTDRLRQLEEFAALIDTEDEEAKSMLGEALGSPFSFAKANVARKGRFYTGGIVRLLCEAAKKECDREPEFALAIAETACLIAEALPDDHYPARGVEYLRGTAWKDYSTACRYLGRIADGFDALSRAETSYRRLIDPGVSLGTIALARATLHFESQRWREALGYVHDALRVFAERGDSTRHREAKEWEAMILQSLGDVVTAREMYRKTYDYADSIGDAEMKARAAENLAVAYRESGDYGSASKYLLVALQLFESLEQPANALIVRWAITRLSLDSGNVADAAHRLPALITRFERLNMVSQAAHAQVDLAEVLLTLGRYGEVTAVCEKLVIFFRNAHMLTGALTAAAFLREANEKRALTREHIVHVRDYLTALARTPDLPFTPPLEIS